MVLGLVSLLLWVLPALVAIILGILSLAKKKPGKGMAITGIVTGTIGIFLMPAVLYIPIHHAIEITQRTSCMANLKGMGTALALYAQANDNAYPQNLEMLIKNGESPKMFKCPSSQTHREFDYFYLAPAKNAPETTLVACDFKDNHKGEMRNVLYMDGHATRLDEPAFQQALTQPENAAFADALKKAEGP
jgi:prepilin-type processing-associated H-X9-DG protein